MSDTSPSEYRSAVASNRTFLTRRKNPTRPMEGEQAAEEQRIADLFAKIPDSRSAWTRTIDKPPADAEKSSASKGR